MDVPTAIDGFKNIISSLNNENSLHFLNWVKENINGEFITKSDKTVFFRISNLHKKIQHTLIREVYNAFVDFLNLRDIF